MEFTNLLLVPIALLKLRFFLTKPEWTMKKALRRNAWVDMLMLVLLLLVCDNIHEHSFTSPLLMMTILDILLWASLRNSSRTFNAFYQTVEKKDPSTGGISFIFAMYFFTLFFASVIAVF